jgi:hypothetical protein
MVNIQMYFLPPPAESSYSHLRLDAAKDVLTVRHHPSNTNTSF